MKPSEFPQVTLHPDETVDVFLEGRLRLIQSREGYRFSVDARFLSTFVSVKPGDLLMDLGTGCGVVPLILLLSRPLRRAIGLELQPELAGQASRNALLNRLEQKFQVVCGDLRRPPFAGGCADVVTCNPPYRRVGSGRVNPNLQKAIARHEVAASLEHILAAARRVLRKRGRLCLIYPSVRLGEVLVQLRRVQLEPKRLQMVHPGIDADAKLALVEAVLGARPGLQVAPPVFGQGEPFTRGLP